MERAGRFNSKTGSRILRGSVASKRDPSFHKLNDTGCNQTNINKEEKQNGHLKLKRAATESFDLLQVFSNAMEKGK
ncbi:MAG TPA: hypothetical protein VEX63_09860 [Flavisolibacter sp.]|nr:hypothetical protein [Flavisolibacter sp.]